jgi:hypothetical protein
MGVRTSLDPAVLPSLVRAVPVSDSDDSPDSGSDRASPGSTAHAACAQPAPFSTILSMV